MKIYTNHQGTILELTRNTFFFLIGRVLLCYPGQTLTHLWRPNQPLAQRLTHLCLPQFWDKRYTTLYLAFSFIYIQLMLDLTLPPFCLSLSAGIIDISYLSRNTMSKHHKFHRCTQRNSRKCPLTLYVRGWSNSSAVKSTCSCRGPQFGSQQP